MKQTIKRLVHYLAILMMLPIFFLYWLLSLVTDKDSAFRGCAQLFSLFPGIVGNYLRAAFYHLAMTHCDLDVAIGFGVLFSQQDTELFHGCYIGPQCNIGKCKIEANCLLGSAVHIMSGKGQHNFDDLNTPLREQGGTFSKVTIGEDSWIGNGALIMANVGKKCVIGAGSVVIDDLPDYAIAAGNPAKILKYRT